MKCSFGNSDFLEEISRIHKSCLNLKIRSMTFCSWIPETLCTQRRKGLLDSLWSLTTLKNDLTSSFYEQEAESRKRENGDLGHDWLGSVSGIELGSWAPNDFQPLFLEVWDSFGVILSPALSRRLWRVMWCTASGSTHPDLSSFIHKGPIYHFLI